MNRNETYDDYEDDEAEGYDEYGDDEYGDEELDEPTMPCPYCRQEIHEEAQRCPYCERYLSSEDAPSSRKPWWIVMGVAVCLLVVIIWLL